MVATIMNNRWIFQSAYNLSSIATIVGSFIHVYFLSSNPLNFDDNQPFKQVIRELTDIPLAYSMFWIVQLLVMTTSIIDDDHQKSPLIIVTFLV